MKAIEKGASKKPDSFQFGGVDIRLSGRGARPHGKELRRFIMSKTEEELASEIRKLTSQQIDALYMTAYIPQRFRTQHSRHALSRLTRVLNHLNLGQDTLPKQVQRF